MIAAGRQKSPSSRQHPMQSKQAQATERTVSSARPMWRPRKTSQPSFGMSGLSNEVIASPNSRLTRPLPVSENKECQSLRKDNVYTTICRPRPIRKTPSHMSVSGGNRDSRNSCHLRRSRVMVVLAVSGRFFQKLMKETQLLEFEKTLLSSFPSVQVIRQRVAEKDSYRR